jgi:RNA polymerase sigma factor (sigma-70 family)
MRAIRGGGSDVQVVIAAQRGDRRALDTLLSQYLPLLYNIVGRAMNGHADADDVVQETMLRAVRSIGSLRDPAAFRSWLVAVAVRQIRDHISARQPQIARDPAPEVADPEADFVDVTILQLGLSGQRRETAEATRWLDNEDREVLALWWQEAAGTLDRGGVASGLGMTPAHTAVRIGRMKERLTTARLVVRALRARPPCDVLAEVTADWDYAPSSLWRKRVARHARDCQRCRSQLTDMVPAEQLLNGLPLLPVPLLAIPAIASHLPQGGQTPAAPRAPGHRARSRSHQARRHQAQGHQAQGHQAQGHQAQGHQAQAHQAAGQHGLPAHASALRHIRFLPKAAAYLQPKLVVAAIAATSCVAAGAVAVSRLHHPEPAKAPPAAHAVAVRPSPLPPPVQSPSPRPSPTHTTAPARVTSALKGVGAWNFSGVTQALAESGASWYYTWSTSQAGIVSPPGASFVPMIWGPASVTTTALDQAKSESHVLLGFNEPDMSAQANMTVAQALSLWPKLMATGMELGSPAVADDAATPGGWLDQFMRGAAARGYRVNFITVHWYGGNFATSAAVSELKSYLQQIYDRYHLPIWVTELGLVNYGAATPVYPTDSEQAAFVTAAASMLARLTFVQRYAWFALPVSSGDGNMGLFTSGPEATEVGRAFEAAGR